MEKPYKYIIIDNETKKVMYSNIKPSSNDVTRWEKVSGKVSCKKVFKTVYVNTRYKAELRLYNYITYTKNNIEIPKYQPFKGIDSPILNF